MTKIKIMLMCSILLATPFASAAVFKCEGPDGAVSYSDRPCKSGVSEELKIGSSKNPENQSRKNQTATAMSSASSNCGKAVKNGQDWLESMIAVGRRNLETGHMSPSEHDKGLSALNQMKTSITVGNCEQATGNNKRFYECLTDIKNHLSLCGQRHQPSF